MAASKRIAKTPAEIRKEAAQTLREMARWEEGRGCVEGADALRSAAASIARIRLRKTAQ